jgi:hypothetical protein
LRFLPIQALPRAVMAEIKMKKTREKTIQEQKVPGYFRGNVPTCLEAYKLLYGNYAVVFTGDYRDKTNGKYIALAFSYNVAAVSEIETDTPFNWSILGK